AGARQYRLRHRHPRRCRPHRAAAPPGARRRPQPRSGSALHGLNGYGGDGGPARLRPTVTQQQLIAARSGATRQESRMAKKKTTEFGVAMRNFTRYPEMPSAKDLIEYGVKME